MAVTKRMLTPEIKEKLEKFNLLGFPEKMEFMYVPKAFRESDVPKEYWPVFKLKGKDGIEVSKFEDDSGHFETDISNPGVQRFVSKTGSRRLETLTHGVIGWKNYFDENGDEVVFQLDSLNQIATESLRRLPAKLQTELYNAIVERTALSEEELEGLEF